MAHFELHIATSNSAFTEYPGELARLIRAAADRVEVEEFGRLHDVNGNRVGYFTRESGTSLRHESDLEVLDAEVVEP